MPDNTDPVIDVTGLGKTYSGGAVALADVTLSIAPGEIFGIIGESGAGKSTLLDLLIGTTRPTDGDVRVLGRSVPGLGRGGRRALRHDIGVVFQSVPLLANRTVRHNVALPLALRRGRTRDDRAAERAAVDEMLHFVGLDERADAFPAELSGGQRQRVGIARALVTRPRLLLCDEPTSSLDATTTDGVLDLLRAARDRFGTTVIVVTHDLAVVRAVCDRVALMDSGRVHEILTVSAPQGRTHDTYLDRARRELGA